MKINAEVTLVTPAVAQAWLKTNTRNRNLNARTISELARAIRNGEWRLNGEAVKIADDGTLLDGQHRLSAIVEADTAVELLVVTGMPVAVQETMDIGRKRTMADALKINGEVNVNVLAAIARRGWMWDQGNQRLSPHNAPTPGELRAYLADNPSLRRSAEVGVRTNLHFRPANATINGLAHHLFARVAQDDAAEFFAQLETGAKLDVGFPVLTLRNRLMSDRAASKKVPDFVQLAYYIKAWNAVRESRELGVILQTAENLIPKIV